MYLDVQSFTALQKLVKSRTDFTELHRYVQMYTVLNSVHSDVQKCTEMYGVVQIGTKFFRNVQRVYRVLQSCTGLYRVEQS